MTPATLIRAEKFLVSRQCDSRCEDLLRTCARIGVRVEILVGSGVQFHSTAWLEPYVLGASGPRPTWLGPYCSQLQAVERDLLRYARALANTFPAFTSETALLRGVEFVLFPSASFSLRAPSRRETAALIANRPKAPTVGLKRLASKHGRE